MRLSQLAGYSNIGSIVDKELMTCQIFLFFPVAKPKKIQYTGIGKREKYDMRSHGATFPRYSSTGRSGTTS
uniref:Uncharacterized protein n=1 Tax=Caenorhabditis japonica TaxID=281687 RepID=A0A8R1IGM6_CAEJA